MKTIDRRSFLHLVASGVCLAPRRRARAGRQRAPAGAAELQPYLDAIRERVAQMSREIDAGPYAPQWEALAAVDEAPTWFRDAKFGIYFHWGPYSVPAFDSEWYPRWMHDTDHRVYRHHVETYGSPAAYPYTRFASQFDAAAFDARQWAALFEKAGARYAGPVAEHHDGFAMWASKVTPWNAAAVGPRRDITGELAVAVRERGMRFVTTFHHARNSLFWQQGQWTGHYSFAKANFPALFDDPKTAWMYGGMAREVFLDMWLAKLGEVVSQYEPDLIWFDSWLDEIPTPYRKRFLAHYYNQAAGWGREVVVTRKQHDLPLESSLMDYEKGRAAEVLAQPWLTDDTISRGSWCYTQNLEIKPASVVLHSLIDIVSKNGCLLLNVSPTASGIIPDDQQAVLSEMGAWLDQNGASIYATRPWETYGEGPTELREGPFGGVTDAAEGYTARDVRYTRSKDGRVLYAIALGWPEGALTLTSVAARGDAASLTARLLGYPGEALQVSINDRGQPVIAVPDMDASRRPGRYAYVFALTGFDPVLHPSVRPPGNGRP